MPGEQTYELYKAGEEVMPATKEDHFIIRRRTGFFQIHPYLQVLEVEDNKQGCAGRHYHPQRLHVRVMEGSRKKYDDIWVSGEEVCHLPDLEKMLKDGTLFAWADDDDKPKPTRTRPG
jgi:hypothetical protein